MGLPVLRTLPVFVMFRPSCFFLPLSVPRFVVPSTGTASLPPAAVQLQWIDAATLPIEGRGWSDQSASPYDRLPARAKAIVRQPVWDLSQDSAGMLIRFSTDSSALYLRWSLRRTEKISMMHMPATSVSGIDLYGRDGNGWRFISNSGSRPTQGEIIDLFKDKAQESRDYILYLPLYNGIASLEIGIDPDARLTPITQSKKPIVCYGTSITQGGCASRPGMAYTALLGRALDREVINLGFSGNALTEPEVVDLLCELSPALYVLNPLPNLQPDEVYPRLKHAIATLRKRHPQVPIVLVESITYAGGWFNEERGKRAAGSTAALKQLFGELSAADPRLYYVSGEALLGNDSEGTVDGTHPNDLGFSRMAAHMEPVIRKALEDAGER